MDRAAPLYTFADNFRFHTKQSRN